MHRLRHLATLPGITAQYEKGVLSLYDDNGEEVWQSPVKEVTATTLCNFFKIPLYINPNR